MYKLKSHYILVIEDYLHESNNEKKEQRNTLLGVKT